MSIFLNLTQSWAISTRTIAATVDVIGYSLGVWTSLFSIIAGSLTLRKWYLYIIGKATIKILYLFVNSNRKEESLAIFMMTMPSMIMGALLFGVYTWNLIKTHKSIKFAL